MFKFKWLVVLFLLVTAVQTSFADDIAKVNGVWKLVSYDVEVQATGDKFPPMGKSPTGYDDLHARIALVVRTDRRGSEACENSPGEGGTARYPGCVHGYLPRGRGLVDYQCRGGLESGMGRYGAVTILQGGRRPTSCLNTVASYAQLGRQGNDS